MRVLEQRLHGQIKVIEQRAREQQTEHDRTHEFHGKWISVHGTRKRRSKMSEEDVEMTKNILKRSRKSWKKGQHWRGWNRTVCEKRKVVEQEELEAARAEACWKVQ